jgi:hypothetical protein
MLCTFQLRGRGIAACEFRDIDGKVWDSFTLSTLPGPKAVEESLLITKSRDFSLASFYSDQKHNDIFKFNNGNHFLAFDLDLHENVQITQAYLQLLQFSNTLTQPAVTITIDVLRNSPKFVQQSTRSSVKLSTETLVDSGHVWNSPDLSFLIQPFTNQKRVVIVLTAVMDNSIGTFGFLQTHPILKSCVAPTLFVTYR